MKILFCICCVVGVASMVLADVKDVNDKVTEKKLEPIASDKSSESKPKRDANYQGPSYKYLPPGAGASSYDSYSGDHHAVSSGFGGGYSSSGIGHSSAFGGGYSSSGIGHSSAGLGGGYSSSNDIDNRYVSSAHQAGHGHHHGLSSSSGLGYASLGSGHHGISSGGHGYVSSVRYAGQGAAHHAPGIKGYPSGPSYTSSVGHSAVPSYHGYVSSGSGSSGIGYKTHSISVPTYALSAGHVGSSAGAGAATGYHYSKGPSGSIPSSGFAGAGFGGTHGVGSSGGVGYGGSHGVASASAHHSDHSDHSDHIHNGNQEHHYVVSSGHSAGAGFGGAHHGAASSASLGQQGGYSYEAPAASYIPTVQQHAIPASSYGVPIATVGDSYSKNYHHSQEASQEQGPIYATGHKGLGHFGFTASKPQVLHTSISGSSFKQPAYSKAPFKPSTFLGSKYEGSSHNEAPSQQYLPPSDVGADSTGYDYPIPSGPSAVYQEPQYQSHGDATPIYEPESTYLPPNHNEASYNDIPTDPSSSYLPPGQTYGVPYSH